MSVVQLTLSTATASGSIAVSRGESLLGEITITPARTQSEMLLPAIDELLAHLELTVQDLDLLSVVLGPGTFTGLRVGVATIKGLALALGKPVVGVSSLQALALQVPEASVRVYALLDARKGEVYSGCFSWEKGLPHPVSAERVIDPSLLLDDIDGDSIFVGDGSVAYRSLIVRKLGSRARFAPWSANLLRSGSAAVLALHTYKTSGPINAGLLNPVYIRPSDAEINLHKTAVDNGIEG